LCGGAWGHRIEASERRTRGMTNAIYETNNGSLESVKIETTYRKYNHIPHIGQRKRMKVNGAEEMLTLNKLTLERRGEWNEDKSGPVYFYKSVEEWGTYFIGW
jgi:hypothetical protein